MIELSKFYAHPVYKNEEKCFYWHQNAAGAGHVPSQAIIGKFYLDGEVRLINLSSTIIADFYRIRRHKNYSGHRAKHGESDELFQTICQQR